MVVFWVAVATRHMNPKVLAAARNKVQRLEIAIEVLGDNSTESRLLTSALQEAPPDSTLAELQQL